MRENRTRRQQHSKTPRKNHATNCYKSENETGSYPDRLVDRGSMNNNNTKSTPSVSPRANDNKNNTNDDNSNFSDLFGEFKEFIKNVNLKRIINVVKCTFNKMKSENNSLSKAAVFIEGVSEIFS